MFLSNIGLTEEKNVSEGLHRKWHLRMRAGDVPKCAGKYLLKEQQLNFSKTGCGLTFTEKTILIMHQPFLPQHHSGFSGRGTGCGFLFTILQLGRKSDT